MHAPEQPVPRLKKRKPGAKPQKTPIWETIAAIGAAIPEEEWGDYPHDSSINLDHYLYGAPKVERCPRRVISS